MSISQINLTAPLNTQRSTVIEQKQKPPEKVPDRSTDRLQAKELLQQPFNLDNAARVLIPELSQNGGKSSNLSISAKNTERVLGPNGASQENDVFVAKFQNTPITITIKKDLIPTADGSESKNTVGIPSSLTVASERGSKTFSAKELGKGDAYLGEGRLNTINFNLNKISPQNNLETKTSSV